jgi:hypothetical protein
LLKNIETLSGENKIIKEREKYPCPNCKSNHYLVDFQLREAGFVYFLKCMCCSLQQVIP